MKFRIVFVCACLFLLSDQTVRAFYNESTGRWLSRDPIEEEGGENLTAFLDNEPVKDWDFIGLCGCTCIRIDILPSEKEFKDKIEFYPVPVLNPVTLQIEYQYRLGVPISVNFIVDGIGCTFSVKEENGGVTGSDPDGKVGESKGKTGKIDASGVDATGIPVKKPGKYKVKYDLKQVFTCAGTDGKTIQEKRHWKASVTKEFPPK
jgi:hypothetical protein